MLINKAYRYELDPNNIQRSSLAQHAEVARFAYNWGLEQRIARYKNNQGDDRFTDAMKQHKLFTSLKKTEFSWMYETSINLSRTSSRTQCPGMSRFRGTV
jgi:putative transposase